MPPLAQTPNQIAAGQVTPVPQAPVTPPAVPTTPSPVIPPPTPAPTANSQLYNQTSQVLKNASSLNIPGYTFNGTSYIPNPSSAGTGTTTGSTPPASPTSSSKSASDAYTAALAAGQKTLDDASAQFQATTSQFEQGTAPLTPAQQAQIDGLKNEYQTFITQQKTANANLTGATTVAQERRGLSRYSPEMAAANIQKVVSDGVTKVADLESKMNTAVATLQDAFETKNYGLVKDAYKALTDAVKEKDATIKETYDAVKAQIADAKTETSATTLAGALSSLNDPTLTDAQKQTAIATALASGSLTAADSKELNTAVTTAQRDAETALKDAADIQHQKVQDAIASADLHLKQATFNASYGVFMNPNGTINTNVNPQNIPGYTTLPNGLSVINDSNNLYKTPTIAGIPVLSPADTKIVTNTSSQIDTINKLQALYNVIATPDWSSTPIGSLINRHGDEKNQYDSLKGTLPKEIQSQLPDVGFFSGNSVINPDTSTQFQNTRNSLNTTISAVAPSLTPPPYGQVFKDPTSAQNYFTQTGQSNSYQKEVDKANTLAQKYFGRQANDGEILQVINGQ